MNNVMVDSNVIIDIFSEDPVWFEWSSTTLQHYAESFFFAINPIIYAEISIAFHKIEQLEENFPSSFFARTPIPAEASFLAGKVFLKYRKNGGKRVSILPDFFIGAHAAVCGMTLITRDTSLYKTYYPILNLVCP